MLLMPRSACCVILYRPHADAAFFYAAVDADAITLPPALMRHIAALRPPRIDAHMVSLSSPLMPTHYLRVRLLIFAAAAVSLRHMRDGLFVYARV